MLFCDTMTKGLLTRQTILRDGIDAAYEVGLGGVTIGELAARTRMSKSGLFAHFGSKEALQLAVLGQAREDFVDEVIRPAFSEPRGEPRIRALFEHWLTAGMRRAAGCCLFVKAATEFDQQPGPLRDQLVRDHKDLIGTIRFMFSAGIEEGHFRPDADAAQFAHDLYGVQLGGYLGSFIGDPDAEVRARRAFEALIEKALAS